MYFRLGLFILFVCKHQTNKIEINLYKEMIKSWALSRFILEQHSVQHTLTVWLLYGKSDYNLWSQSSKQFKDQTINGNWLVETASPCESLILNNNTKSRLIKYIKMIAAIIKLINNIQCSAILFYKNSTHRIIFYLYVNLNIATQIAAHI